MPIGSVAPQIALLIGAAVCLVAAIVLPHRRQWVCAPLAGLGVAASAGLTLEQILSGPQATTFFGTFAVDGTAGWAAILILGVTLLVLLLSPEWMGTDPRHGEYYALLLLSALGAILLAGATDTMQMVVGVLLSSITGYTLAAYHRRSGLSVEAGMKYFLVGALANALLLVGVALLFGLAGTTLYAETRDALAGGAVPAVALVGATVSVAVGLAFKLGAVPAHAWLPDVAQGSPAPAAAFLTVVPKIGGLVAVARLLALLPDDGVGWRAVAALLAAATMTLGNLAALWQEDVRRLLGWSAVSQSGYGLMAVVAVGRSDQAIPALLFFLAGYAVANVAAFAVVTELRGRTSLEDYRGLSAARPWLAAGLTVAFLSLVGVPPLAGFVGKLELFLATIDAGYAWLAALAVANTVVSLFYYLRVVGPMYFAPSPAPVPVLGRWAGIGAGVAAAGTVAIGLAAAPLLTRFADALLLP